MDGQTLAAHQSIRATVETTDGAGKVIRVQAVQNYTLALQESAAQIVWDDIAGDNRINAVEAQGKVILSGQIVGLKDGEEATVSVQIGNQSHLAQVVGQRFSVYVDGTQLAGNQRALAVLAVSDAAYNRTEKTAVREYVYDIQPPSVQITVDPVHQGKTLNQADSLQSVRISGQLRHDSDLNPDLAVYDLAFMHYRFGVNPEARKGNDTYRFQAVNPEQTDLGIYLWDGGGVDTFDASDQIQGVNVNLTPGSWIYAGKKTENFVIDAANGFTSQSFFGLSDSTRTTGAIVDAMSEKYKYTHNQAFIGYGTQIENLVGSAYDDVLTGNNAANRISGGAGDDTLNGGGGNDYLDGGAGKDVMSGGTGDDVYVVNQSDDSVSERANEGNDTVYSYADYVLGEHLENLHLYGAAQTATGNAANNVLVGNAADNRLEGKGGSDTLTGGAGRDTFVFSDLLSADTVTDFVAGEDTLALSREVFTAINGTADILSKVSYS